MNAQYFQKGETLDYTPEEAVKGGSVVSLKTRIGIVAADTAAKELGQLHVVGVFRMDKEESKEVKLGDALYYKTDGDKITTDAESNIPAGYAAAASAATDTDVLVNIGFPPAPAAASEAV